MICTDFVMLGKTVPEPNRDGRVFVCSAGVSAELGSLIRIYPLARRNAPARWEKCTVPLERNPKDTRHESWKIAGDRSPGAHENINQSFSVRVEVPDTHRPELLRPFQVSSVAAANRLEQSLAVVHPRQMALVFERAAEGDEDSPQLSLFDLPDERPSKPSARFRYIPRVVFRDEEGEHKLQIRDWGVYELMRKHGDEFAVHELRKALHLRDGSSLLVGNQNNRRTSWLIISVLNGIRIQAGLWDRLPSERPFIPLKTRQRVMMRDNGVCQRCGRKAVHIDHVLPFIRGGRSSEDNLQALCESCNLSKSDEMAA